MVSRWWTFFCWQLLLISFYNNAVLISYLFREHVCLLPDGERILPILQTDPSGIILFTCILTI